MKYQSLTCKIGTSLWLWLCIVQAGYVGFGRFRRFPVLIALNFAERSILISALKGTVIRL